MKFMQCIRVIVIACNSLLFILGMVVLSVSVYAQLEPTTQDYVNASGQDDALKISLYVLIVIGSGTVIASTIGFCGAYHESPCLLAAYFVILLIILCAQISLGVLGFVFKNDIVANTHQSLLEGVVAYISPDSNQRRVMAQAYLDTIQKTLKCCGANGPNDFDMVLPNSCCQFPLQTCTRQSSVSSFYQQGCTQEYKKFVSENMIYFFITIIFVCVLEFLCLLFATVLYCSARIETSYNYDGLQMVDL